MLRPSCLSTMQAQFARETFDIGVEAIADGQSGAVECNDSIYHMMVHFLDEEEGGG